MIDTSLADGGSVDSVINDPSETALGWFSTIKDATVDIIRASKGATPDQAYSAGSDDWQGPQIPLDVAVSRGIVTYAPGQSKPLAAGLNLGTVSPMLLIGGLVLAFVLLRK